MKLSNCLFISDVEQQQYQMLELVLKTTQSVLTLTKGMSSYKWFKNEDKVFVTGEKEELAVVEQSLRTSLGLLPDELTEDNPF